MADIHIDPDHARQYLLQIAAKNPACPWLDLYFWGFTQSPQDDYIKGTLVGTRPNGTRVFVEMRISSCLFPLAADSHVEVVQEAIIQAKMQLDDLFHANLRDMVKAIRKNVITIQA